MASIWTRLYSHEVGCLRTANDNVTTCKWAVDPTDAFPPGWELHTAENLLVTRDPKAACWIVKDFEGESTLFDVPDEFTLAQVLRASALYTTAFKAGFEQGQSLPRARSKRN